MNPHRKITLTICEAAMNESTVFIMICNLERYKDYMKQTEYALRIGKLLNLLNQLYNHALLPSQDTIAEYENITYSILGVQP